MMKEVVRALETGHLAEIGLIAFVLAFVLIVVRALATPRSEREKAKHIPLNDQQD